MQARHITLLIGIILTVPLVAGQQVSDSINTLKTGGTPYFTAKMDNLTQQLQLSPDQATKIRPIAEQEVGYLEEIRSNPVLSKKDKLKKLQDVVQNSDANMKPMLSAEQWQKLQTLRKDQKQQLKELAKQNKPSENTKQ